MTTGKTFAAVLLSLLTGSVALADNNPPYKTGNDIHTNQPFTRVGGDLIKFGLSLANGCDEAALDAAAIQLKNHSTSDKWDDQWYAFRVPQGRCLMIGWYNTTKKKYGWAAAQNMPNTWGFTSNNGRWENVGNGVQRKYRFKINGQAVDLDLFNPQNEGGLSGDDVLVSFGY